MTTANFGAADSDAPMYCANHPKEQTYLRCGRCDKPICAKCRVHTPVGFRCYQCANLQTLPTYAIGTDILAKAVLGAAIAAAAAGVLMGLFPGFEFWAALLMGIVVPEAIGAATNQKRGPSLQFIAMAAVVFGFALSRVVMMALPGLISLGGINSAPLSGIRFIDQLPLHISIYTVIWLALALFLANRRLR